MPAKMTNRGTNYVPVEQLNNLWIFRTSVFLHRTEEIANA